MGYNKLNSLVANTRAIGVAFQLRKEQRKATVEERAVLQQYSGFGGTYCRWTVKTKAQQKPAK